MVAFMNCFPTQMARYFWLSEENGFQRLLLPNTNIKIFLCVRKTVAKTAEKRPPRRIHEAPAAAGRVCKLSLCCPPKRSVRAAGRRHCRYPLSVFRDMHLLLGGQEKSVSLQCGNVKP